MELRRVSRQEEEIDLQKKVICCYVTAWQKACNFIEDYVCS